MSRKLAGGAFALEDYFGTRPTPMSFAQWLQDLEARIATPSGVPALSACHNLHSLYQLRRDPRFKSFYAQSVHCYTDGVAALLPQRLAGIPAAPGQRFSLMDHFEELLEEASRRSWRLAYVGSRPEVVNSARCRLDREYPRLQIHLEHGYFASSSEVVARVNEFSPDLLLVGMGMPRQEHWLLAHRQQLQARVACQAGATLDYFVGAQARPPRWLSRVGLAWLYRLVHDPRRLWRRYLWEPWVLLGPTVGLFRATRGRPRKDRERR